MLSTTGNKILSFIQNVSSNFSNFSFSSSLEGYTYDNIIGAKGESHHKQFEGSIVALDTNGRTEAIDIDNDAKHKRLKQMRKYFRIKPHKMVKLKSKLNKAEEHVWRPGFIGKKRISTLEAPQDIYHPQFQQKKSTDTMRKSIDSPMRTLERSLSEFSFKKKLGNPHLDEYVLSRSKFGAKSSQGLNPKQSLRFNLPPTLLDSRPCITYREGYDFNEALPQQYTDILSSRDSKLRMSCPREIKGDPIDIDNSIIMTTPKRPKIPHLNRQKRKRYIIQ